MQISHHGNNWLSCCEIKSSLEQQPALFC
uniref:Uncharacterized protein n=1 Tax=Anguilla anguilla TaxID=7936 RepID=A0A0E9U629_ANGAN